MSSLPCTAASDAQLLHTYITDYATHPNQLLVNGQVFASTFSGSDCTFGQGSSQAGWSSQFLQQLTGQNTVHFVPSFFIDPNTFSEFDEVMDGSFNVRFAFAFSHRALYVRLTFLVAVEWRLADFRHVCISAIRSWRHCLLAHGLDLPEFRRVAAQ